MVDLPIEHGDFPSFFVCVPEGIPSGNPMCGSGPGALHGRRAPWLGPQKGGRAWAIFPGPQTVTSLLVDQSLKIYKYIYHDIIIMISIIMYLSFCEIDRSWSSSTAT